VLKCPLANCSASNSGIITTLVGTGKPGRSDDGGKASEAALREPNDCCLDGKGGLLIADVGDGRIRRVDLLNGKIATFAGTGRHKGKVDRSAIGDGGPADKAVLVGARAVCVDGKGNTYICEREGNAVRKVDARGIITTLAGTGAAGYGDGVAATTAALRAPSGIALDSQGDLYIADTGNQVVREISADGILHTVAGTPGKAGAFGDGGPAVLAQLSSPMSVAVRPDGDVLIVLSHVGLSLDRKLARAVPRIDLILGGHSHDTLFQPEYAGDVPIVHAGPHGQYVSRTELQYDDARQRMRISDFALVPLLGPP